MTALDMIREGFSVWADSSLGENMYSTPIIFTLLFLFGFLATAVVKTIRLKRATVADPPGTISDEGREIIDDANTARLFELESELAASKDTLKRFTETLSTTFAHLSGGLAIFDADKSLYLFNPALSDLFDLDPVWLAGRPSIADFISKLREKRHLPEKKNFLEWRRLLTELKDTGQQKTYDDEWVLPDGRVFRVTGQPHSRGAVAFLFEDISVQVAIERLHRQETAMNHSILNGISDAIAVVGSSGSVKFTNTSLDDLFGEKFREDLVNCGIPDTADFWQKLKTYVSLSERPAPWEHMLTAKDNSKIRANVSPLPDGSTLVVFKVNTKFEDKMPTGQLLGQLDPLHLGNLENMLLQRDILFDHTGFHSGHAELEDATKLRRVLWYLVIAAANNCRTGGKVVLSSRVAGQCTTLSCRVSGVDHVDGVHENVAANLLELMTAQPDAKNIWVYDSEADPFTVSFKMQKPLTLSAV